MFPCFFVKSSPLPLPLSLLTSFCLLFLSLHPYSPSAHSLSPTILLRCPCKLRWKWDSLRGELSFITHHRPDPGHINYNSPSGHLRKHTHVCAHTHTYAHAIASPIRERSVLGCSSTANPPQVFPRVSRNEWHLISTPTVWKIVTPIHTSAFLIYTRAPWVELLNEMSVWMYLPFPEVFLSPNFHRFQKIRIYRAQADRVQRQWVKKTEKTHLFDQMKLEFLNRPFKLMSAVWSQVICPFIYFILNLLSKKNN